jgi:hypothetical protein
VGREYEEERNTALAARRTEAGQPFVRLSALQRATSCRGAPSSAARVPGCGLPQRPSAPSGATDPAPAWISARERDNPLPGNGDCLESPSARTVIARRPGRRRRTGQRSNLVVFERDCFPQSLAALGLGTRSLAALAPRNPHEPRRTPNHESTWEGRRPRRPGPRLAAPPRGRGRPRSRSLGGDFLDNDSDFHPSGCATAHDHSCVSAAPPLRLSRAPTQARARRPHHKNRSAP